jgi:ketosteroid isomerase-like protein
MRLLVVYVTLGLASALPWAQTPATPEQEIRIIEAFWLEAIVDGHGPTLDGILADDYVAVHSSGLVMNKEQDIALTVSKKGSIPALGFGAPRDLRTRVFGDTAVTTGSLTLVRSQGAEREFRRFTHVYVRRNGRWQCVSSHLTEVPFDEVVRQREAERTARFQVWTAQKPAHYRFTVALRYPLGHPPGPAVIEVRQGQTVAINGENGKPLENTRVWDRLNTIEKVFETIRGAQAFDVLEVTYDSAKGYPTVVSIDPETYRSDDESQVRISEFTVLPD